MSENFGLKIGLEGEKEFKKSLADINNSFKVLGSEMKLVDSQFDKNDKSAEALTARNQVLNKEIEQQKQKIDTLRTALQNAAESFGENDRRTQSWQIQLNNAQAALNGMERELNSNNVALANADKGFDEAGDEAKNFSGAVKKAADTSKVADGKLNKLGDTAKKIGAALGAAAVAVGTACVAAGKKLWDMANDVGSTGDQIDKTSQKIGISAESYQKWGYVFERCGADVDNLQSGMKKLSTVITDAANGSDSAAEKLSAVGLSIEDLNGKSQDEQLALVIEALQGMESGAERTAAANDLLGKSATDMAAVLNITAEETERLKQEAENYGMVMSNEAVAASAAFEDSLTRLSHTAGGLKNRMVGELLPGITQITDGLADLLAGNDNAADELKNGVSSVIDAINTLIPQAAKLVSSIAGAVLESAPGIIKALADGLLSAISELTPTLAKIVIEIISALVGLLPQIVSAGADILLSLIKGIADTIPQLIPQIVTVVVEIVKTLIDNLPLIYNGEELVCEYTKVISSRLTDSLSGECTFEFTITSAMASDIRAEHEIRLIGTYLDYRFNIAKIEKSISNGLTICTVTCEHKSYELNNEQYEISEFEFKGNAADALALLLQGTSLKPGECDVTVPVDMKINQKCSRRAALMQLIALCCGEIEYASDKINIRAHRGSNDARMVMGGKSVSNLTLSADLRAATQTYGLTLYKKLDFAVGDNIRIVFRPFNLDVETRIITAEYNPFNCREISIEVGSYYPTISDDLYKIKQVANEVENKVQDLEDSTAMMKVATNGTDVSIGGLANLIISIPYTALTSTYAAFCITVKFTLTTAGTVVFLLQKDNAEVLRYSEYFDTGAHTKTYSYLFASLQGMNTIHFSVLSSDGAAGVLPMQQTWGYVLGAYLAGDEPWDGRIKVAETISGVGVLTKTIIADEYSEILTIDLINRLDLIFADRAGAYSAEVTVTADEWNGEFILPHEVCCAYYIDSTHLGVKFLNIHTMSADGELMLTILASYAQEESCSASENQKWRVKKNFEAGKPWRCYMLGYRLHDGQYYIVDEEAEVVRRIYREYLDGAGFKLIARGLNEDNIPTMNGGEWHHRTIATILQNYTYTGNLLLQKTYKENYITKKKMMNTGQQPRYLVEKAHEAIIPLEQWQAVQYEIKRRRDYIKASYSSKVTFLYTGLIQCAKCGKNYRRKTTSSRVVWCCATYNTKGKKYCNSKQIPETVLDSLMEQITDDPSTVVKIIAADNNTIHFHFSDGTVITRTWKYNSRAETWTPEKREAARQKTYERNKNNGKSSHDNTSNQG